MQAVLRLYALLSSRGRKLPLYYGQLRIPICSIRGLLAAEGFEKIDGILPAEGIQIAQFGIIFSGFISIIAGLLVRFAGRNRRRENPAAQYNRACCDGYWLNARGQRNF